MYATRYIKAVNIDEAIAALSAAEDGKILAGGMTLIPTLKQRLAAPDCLIDLSATGLSAITDEGEEIAIGAMATHAEVEHSVSWFSNFCRFWPGWLAVLATARYAIAVP